uniref:Reverse transcriptase Ty1/copia-type domain-containing protein n=1 Tax=Trichuris muris TaxID=70415 RepID=A0A5S6QQI6_TRIMR
MPEGARELELKKQIGKSIEPSSRGAEVNVENIFESPKQELPSQEEIEVSSNESLLSPALRRSQRLNKGIPPQKLSYKVHTAEACEPSSWEEVTNLPPCERDKWMAAAKEEMASLKNREVWELVELPAGRKVISSKWVFKIKRKADGAIDTYKARLVARGFSQRYGEDYDEIFAPVVKHETIRMILSIAAMRSLHVRHFDVKCAYLNGEIHEELYMEQPPGFVQPGNENLVLRLKRSIYGLKQSARAWNKKATEVLTSLGFDRANADLCLYTRRESTGGTTYVLLYVDDLLVAGETEEITRNIGAKLNMHFVTKDLGEVSSYLGMQIERQEDGAFLLHQHSKIEQLLKKVGMSEAKPMGTPIETGYLSTMNEFSVPLPNNVQYRQVIGSLLYIATVSRPDIALAVGLLCRRTESPTEYDWKCVKHVLRCLAGTKYMKLYVSATSEPILQGYVDADWAGDKADRKSTSGFMFHLGGSTISWFTRKQTSVALSSTEADYVAMAEACKELLWLRQLLEDFGIPQKSATTIFEDNQGCIRLIDSEKLNDRTKHISVRYHLLKDLRERHIIEVKYCPSHQMMADALTKPVSKEQLSRFVRQVRLLNCE